MDGLRIDYGSAERTWPMEAPLGAGRRCARFLFPGSSSCALMNEANALGMAVRRRR